MLVQQAGPVVLGAGIRVRGSVKGAEDVVLRGHVDGTVTLPANTLTVESGARLDGDVDAQSLTLRGELTGDVSASEQVRLDPGARVVGDLKTDRLVVAEGALFQGHVEMAFELPAGLERKR
ncbi:MAG: polymer-forming cytoskeletal protein [Myxococcota bacterium]